MLVAGDRDQEAKTVSVRLRSGEDLGAMPIDRFLHMAGDLVANRAVALK